MAEEHNAIKYGPQISKAAAIAAGGGYGDVGISRLSESLTPIIDLWSRPEWSLLRGEILFARIPATIPAVALRNSSLELVNPSTSTKVVVLRGVQNFTGATMEYNLDAGTAIAANPVTTRGVACDTRFAFGEVSLASIVTGDVAAGIVAPANALVASAAQLMALLSPPLIVGPGNKIFFINPTQATANRISLFWSERIAFPGELQARG